MANPSIFAAFERMWQHVVNVVSTKADYNHSHDDEYYTEAEIDLKLNDKADSYHSHSISNVTNLQSALDGKVPTSRTVNGKSLEVNIALSASDVGASPSSHNHDEDYDVKGSAASALESAKSYADTAAGSVKNDLLNGAGAAYDTLKELGDLIDENVDAIEALETVAAGKADKVHNHDDRYYTESEIDIKLSDKSDVDHDHSFIVETNKNLEQRFWRGTQAEYDAIETKDDTTMYIVLDGEDAVIGGGVGSLEELGVFATAEELNFVDGVTSNIQAQIDGKIGLSDLGEIAYVDNDEYTDAAVPLNADTLCGKDISYFAQKSDIKPKAGFIYPLATPNVPDGFLLCDGAAYSRTEYVELFAAIGTYYGEGDGSTTFNVPNLQTRVPVGAGNGYELGSVGGEEKHMLTVDEMPSHDHRGARATGRIGYSDGSSDGKMDFTLDYGAISTRTDLWIAVEAQGSDDPHNNMQPYTVINYIISTGKESAVYIRDVINGAQVMPLEVQYGGTGATTVAEARKKIGAEYKHNLLDNSDFSNLVNQRGLTAYDYQTKSDFGIDRWYITGTTLTVNDESVSISINPEAIGNGGGIYQGIEMGKIKPNKTYTFAAKRVGMSPECMQVFTNGENGEFYNDKLYISYDFEYQNNYVGLLANGDWEWAALYEGEYTVETLPPYMPKGYGAELVECLRYYQLHLVNFKYNEYYDYLPISIPMRITPSVVAVETYEGTTRPEVICETNWAVYATLPDGADANAWVDALIILSADL